MQRRRQSSLRIASSWAAIATAYDVANLNRALLNKSALVVTYTLPFNLKSFTNAVCLQDVFSAR